MSKTFKKVKHEFTSSPKKNHKPIPLPALNAKIAESAYYKAQARGFVAGYDLNDWLEAERDFSF
jgi:hypothetical protein